MTSSEPGTAKRWGPLWGARPDDWAAIEQQQTPNYEEALRRVGLQPGEHVLDIGCGAGTFLRVAADRGARVSGFDAAESLLEIARRRVPDADLRSGDMQSLPFEDHTFDLVTGFNSFFFAADMVKALREAGRVAKSGAPILMQVWGRPEHCDLTALKRAVSTLLPAPDPNAAPPTNLFEQGVLEGIITQAGLSPDDRFETTSTFQYSDTETMLQKTLAPGSVVAAVQYVGEAAVRAAILEAFAPYRTSDGGYTFQNEWHFVVARSLRDSIKA